MGGAETAVAATVALKVVVERVAVLKAVETGEAVEEALEETVAVAAREVARAAAVRVGATVAVARAEKKAGVVMVEEKAVVVMAMGLVEEATEAATVEVGRVAGLAAVESAARRRQQPFGSRSRCSRCRRGRDCTLSPHRHHRTNRRSPTSRRRRGSCRSTHQSKSRLRRSPWSRSSSRSRVCNRRLHMRRAPLRVCAWLGASNWWLGDWCIPRPPECTNHRQKWRRGRSRYC